MTKMMRTNGAILGSIAAESAALPYIFMRSKTLMEKAPKICWNLTQFGELAHMTIAGTEAIHRHGMSWNAWTRSYHKYLGRGEVELDVVTAWAFGEKRMPAQMLRDRTENTEIGAICSGQVLLRQIPIVIAGLNWDTQTLFEQVKSEVTLTHTNEEVIELAQIFALCLQQVINGKTRLEIWDDLFAHVQLPGVYRILLASYYEKPICDRNNYSHAHITFQLALYHFWHNTPFVSAIRSVVLMGGATDVNAAAVGALTGASQGIQAIPQIWYEHMTQDYEHPISHMIVRTLHRAENILFRYALLKPQPGGYFKFSHKPHIHKITSRIRLLHPRLRVSPESQEACTQAGERRLK